MATYIKRLEKLFQIHEILSKNTVVRTKDLDQVLGQTTRNLYYLLQDLEMDWGAIIKREKGSLSYVKPAKIPNPKDMSRDVFYGEEHLSDLYKSIDLAQNFPGLPHKSILQILANKLEFHLGIEKTNSLNIIHTDSNANFKGLVYFDKIYNSIIDSKKLLITYQPYEKPSFKKKSIDNSSFYNSSTNTFHWTIDPWILKEYKNRWHLIGYSEEMKKVLTENNRNNEGIVNISLDRIKNIIVLNSPALKCPKDFMEKFNHVIGFTFGPIKTIRLRFNNKSLPYALSLPLHWSQELIKKDEKGGVVSLKVAINREIKQEIIKFLPNVKILSPKNLMDDILCEYKE